MKLAAMLCASQIWASAVEGYYRLERLENNVVAQVSIHLSLYIQNRDKGILKLEYFVYSGICN